MTLRPCPEVSALIEKLGEWGDALGIEYIPETGNFAVFGGVYASYTGIEVLDDDLAALGKYATEASIFYYNAEGSRDGGGVFVVGPTAEAVAACLSEYHYDDACNRLPQMNDQHVRELLEATHVEHLARLEQAMAGVTE